MSGMVEASAPWAGICMVGSEALPLSTARKVVWKLSKVMESKYTNVHKDGCGPWVMPSPASVQEAGKSSWMRSLHPADRLQSGVEEIWKRDSHRSSPRNFADYETILQARLRNKFSDAGISHHSAAAMTVHAETTS